MKTKRQSFLRLFRLPLIGLLLGSVCGLLVVQSCKEESPPPPSLTEITEPENALSEALMLSLGQAQNYHRKGDVLVSEGKIDEAANEVAKVLEIPFPKDAPESEDVILDTRARLAKLRVRQGKLDKAMKLVDEGIAMSTRESFFVANLHTVRGEIFQARAEAADAIEENSEEARQAKRAAIEAFDASIQINNALLDKLDVEKQSPGP